VLSVSPMFYTGFESLNSVDGLWFNAGGRDLFKFEQKSMYWVSKLVQMALQTQHLNQVSRRDQHKDYFKHFSRLIYE
jgi:hypothetical protein